jgi:hypothetical protein
MGATPHAPVGILWRSIRIRCSAATSHGLGAAGEVAAEAAHKHIRRRGECVRSATACFGFGEGATTR